MKQVADTWRRDCDTFQRCPRLPPRPVAKLISLHDYLVRRIFFYLLRSYVVEPILCGIQKKNSIIQGAGYESDIGEDKQEGGYGDGP